LATSVQDIEDIDEDKTPQNPWSRASRRLSIAVQSAQGLGTTTVGGVVKTRVRPSLRIQPNPARNKHFVDISGHIPGPHNDRVTVIFQGASRARTHWFEFRSALSGPPYRPVIGSGYTDPV
jgi:hypothetical protein